MLLSPHSKIRYLIFLPALCFIALTVYYIANHHVWPLSRDQWHMYAPYFENGLWQTALTPMSGHRHLLPFIFFHIDMEFFKGNNHFLVFLGALFNALIIALFFITLKKQQGISWLERTALFLFIAVEMTWLLHIAQMGWGFMSSMYYCVILSYLASVTFAYKALQENKHRALYLIVSIVLGVICTFTFGVGMLIWPTLLVFAYLWNNDSRAYIIFFTALMFCLIAFLVLPGGDDIKNALLFNPASTLRFVFTLAGGPVYYLLKSYRFLFIEGFDVEIIKILSACVGVIVTSASILFCLQQLKTKKSMTLFQTLCFALLMLGLSASVLISFTRMNFALDVWVDRYQIWATMIWLGFLPLLYLFLKENSSKKIGEKSTKGLLAIFLLLPFLALPSQMDLGVRLSEYKIRVNNALLTFQVGIPSKEDAQRALHWNWEGKLPYFFYVLDQLQQRNKNIYTEDNSAYLGKSLYELKMDELKTDELKIGELNIKTDSFGLKLERQKIEAILAKDLLDSEQYLGFQNSEWINTKPLISPEDIIAYQVFAAIPKELKWSYGLLVNQQGIVQGLAQPIEYSIFPRGNFKYNQVANNLYGVVRNVDLEQGLRLLLFNEQQQLQAAFTLQ